VSRPRAADDFATIRARMEELRREREGEPPTPLPLPRRGGELERRRRIEARAPPWAPTALVKKPRR
jgi:hypothetical protein